MTRIPDDRKDHELLNILRSNARLPLSEIAKTLKVSRSTVQARLNRLERDGHIQGYTIVSGAEKQDPDHIWAIILIELEVKTQTRVISELQKIPEVKSCYTTSGHHDLFVLISCRNPPRLDAILDEIAQKEGVKRTNSSILLSRKIER